MTKLDTPQWMLTLFDPYFDEYKHAARLLHLTIQGIASLRGQPGALRALSDYNDARPEHEHSPITQSDIDDAEQNATFVQQELDNGFPMLHAQGVVATWSSLEHLVSGFIREWLLNRTGALDNEVIGKLQVTLSEYVGKAAPEQCDLIVHLLAEKLGASRRRGVERFECMLKVFDLSGGIDPQIARDIFELQQVRNVIVHRASRVDRRFIDACPWMTPTLDAVIRVTHDDYARYAYASLRYATELHDRARLALGLERFFERFFARSGVDDANILGDCESGNGGVHVDGEHGLDFLGEA